MESRIQELEQRLQETLAEVGQLEQVRDAQSEEMAELRQKFTVSEQQFAMLQGDYDDLEVKYNKLIRPARSASGKYVVEVRYWRTDGEYQLSMREPRDEAFRPMSLEALHQTLGALRDRMPEELYIRIIFPEESGLSYAEAWGFTQDLLSQYDYYHRDQ